jgi:AsmA protein
MSGSRKRKWLWWSLGLVGAVLLAATLFALIFSFDGEAIKQGLIDQVRAEKQRELRIDGPLRLKLLPRLSVEAQSVSLSNRDGKGEFLRLGRVNGALEILPLLTGKIIVNRIEIRDWSLQIERDAEGRYNFDDLMVSMEDDSAPLDLEVEKLLLLNGDIHWRDAMSGGEAVVTQVYLRSDHLGRQAHGKLEMGGNLRGGEADAHLGFVLETLYRLDGAAQTLQLDQARLTLKGQGYGMARARLSLSARYARGDLSQMALDLVQLHLQGEGERAGETLTGALDLGELHWQRAALPRLKKLSASLELKGAADKARARLSLDEGPARDEPLGYEQRLSLDWQGVWKEQGYQGKLFMPVRFVQDTEGLHLRVEDMRGNVRLAESATFSKALDMFLKGKLAFDFGMAGEAQGAGELRLTQENSNLDTLWRLRCGQPSRLSFQASLNQLNLDQYLRGDAADAAQGKAQTQGQKPPLAITPAATPAATSAKNAAAGLEVEGTMRVGVLQYKGLRMENLESHIRLEQGRLEMVSGTPSSPARPSDRPPARTRQKR